MAPTHTTTTSSSPSSSRPQTPVRANKKYPTRDVSSSASRRLRASPRYQRYLAKNRSDAAATKHDAAASGTAKATDNIASSSSEEGEESSEANTSQAIAKAGDRTIMSPPRDSSRPFSRLEKLGFDADHSPHTHSAQGNGSTCENSLAFSRQVSPAIAEVSLQNHSSPGDGTDVLEGNELDDIIARACGNPSLLETARPSAPVSSAITSTTEEAHNHSDLQYADGGIDSSDMVSISDATVKQGNTIDDQDEGRDSYVSQTTPKRRTSKGSAFMPSPRRSPAPKVPEKGEVSPSARLVRLEVENGKLRNEVSRLITEVGIKDAIIADLKQCLNDLKPNEGHRAEAKSLKRVLQKERDFVPLNILHEPLDQKFLC